MGFSQRFGALNMFREDFDFWGAWRLVILARKCTSEAVESMTKLALAYGT